ncbi:MAG: Cdc6/Cdc18 family protein [Halovenus sp.]
MLTDPQVFDDGRLPRRLQHRGSEVKTLARAFEPALHGDRAQDVLLSGPSGVGKTTLTRYTLERSTKHGHIQSAYVPCLGLTTAGILRSVLKQLPGPDPGPTTPREDLDLQLYDRVDEPAIIILDEADAVTDTTAVQRLCDTDLLSVVVISHDPHRWLTQADFRARRYMERGQGLRLEHFSTSELVDILAARARRGLRDGAIDESQLGLIARGTAGVARYGIQSLRAAAVLAGDRGHDTIRDEDIHDGFERAKLRMLRLNLRSLPVHHHVLYEIVREAGRIQPRDLYDRYEEIAARVYDGRETVPVDGRQRRNALSKLRAYDLIDYDGPDNQYREYYVTHEEIESPLDLAVGQQQQH